MSLHIYNVRTRQKQPFAPRQPGKVGMYVCGLTVYDHMHIGHARTAVSFEVIRRWLERSYDLTYVQNVTDVDDNIINRAAELGVSPLEHAALWDEQCRIQQARLGVRAPDLAPHATTDMPGIIDYIGAIVETGFAYATDAGNVYFDVPRYDAHARQHYPGFEYGSLSNRDYREMAAGTRKDVETDKRNPADFALWKAAKPTEPEDAQWDSPWGKGRPGWHIECSHMSTDSLGTDQIDIHGGGQDLIFPHHENEIAQTQAKTGKAPFVNVWMHTGFLNIDGTKMSKSLGNYVTLQEMLDELEGAGIDPAVLRFYFVQTHYRTRIDFSRQGLEEAATAVKRLERARALLTERAAGATDKDSSETLESVHEFARAFTAAMDDDFHTPEAVASMFRLARAVQKADEAGLLDAAGAKAALEEFERAGQALTLFDKPVETGVPAAVQELLTKREAARAAKNWAEADAMRDAIAAAGYIIQDRPTGPIVEKA